MEVEEEAEEHDRGPCDDLSEEVIFHPPASSEQGFQPVEEAKMRKRLLRGSGKWRKR